MRICVVTHFPSPYQVELFDAVACGVLPQLEVIYLFAASGERHWASRSMSHVAHFPRSSKEDARIARRAVADSDLVVFNYYRDGLVRGWIRERMALGRPWCFWGERPGFRFRGPLADLVRRFLLRTVITSRAPVWGIGEWAVDEYRRLLGDSREFFNVPYYSRLERFGAAGESRSRVAGCRRILFSGSLIPRKGIDLLADAYRRVAGRNPGLTLDVLGDGPMRRSLETFLSPLNDRVRFHGFQDWDETARFYANADVLCVPSRYDGWGLVVPEGLASGLPVIAGSQMGAAVDLVRNGANGWVVESGSAAALEGALDEVATMSEVELENRSGAARESVAMHTLTHGAVRFARAAIQSRAVWTADGSAA